MYRDEKKMRSESEEKLKRLVNFLVKMKENLVKDNHGDDDLQGRFRALLQELEKELQRANSKRSSSNEKRSQVLESEQANQWKTQRDAAETERDKLETKLKLQLKRARDREQEIEAMWSEREKDLVARCSHLESGLAQWEAKYKTRGAEIMKEQKARKQEMEMYCKEWADEKASWEAMVSQREDWLEEQVAKWTSLLDAKDHDLLKLKISYQELNHAATATKERLNELEQQVYENRRALSEHSTQTSFLCGRSPEESEGDNCLSIVKFVNETDMEEESTKMETEKLKVVRNELGMKTQDAFNMIKAL
jgi:myosin protein heavy chain